MLLRFSLYGFLKNQRYFEPFFLLAMVDKLESFTNGCWLMVLGESVLRSTQERCDDAQFHNGLSV